MADLLHIFEKTHDNIVVVNNQEDVKNVISIFDLLAFFLKNTDLSPAIAEKPIGEMPIYSSHKQEEVEPTAKTIDILKLMHHKQRSSVAVIGAGGLLLGQFTIKNLIPLAKREHLFDLEYSVSDFSGKWISE